MPQNNAQQNKRTVTPLKSSKNNEHAQINSDQRPALAMLNQLNSKLIQSETTYSLERRLGEVERQNMRLKEENNRLGREIQLQRKLRKEWNKIE